MSYFLNSKVVLVAFALAGSGLLASTICNTCSIATGQSPNTANLASDPYWTIYSAAQGNTSGPAVVIGKPIWGLSLPSLTNGISWIGTIPAPGASNGTYAAGDYIYELDFTAPAGAALTGFMVATDNFVNVFLDPSSATLAATFAAYADAPCTGCLVHWGDWTDFSSSGWASWSPPVSQGLTVGSHVLYLEVQNGGGPSGVVAQGTLSTQGGGNFIVGASPEPSTWTMLGLALGLIALRGARRRRAL